MGWKWGGGLGRGGGREGRGGEGEANVQEWSRLGDAGRGGVVKRQFIFQKTWAELDNKLVILNKQNWTLI